mgnify:CR=1 FL=1
MWDDHGHRLPETVRLPAAGHRARGGFRDSRRIGNSSSSRTTASARRHNYSREKLTTLLAVYRYEGFDQALDMVRQIYEVGGKGHSCGIYSHDDDHIDRLARVAPVSRMMVRQPQSKANAGSFTNGMPMTSSLGCGIWGGNITNENIHLKHFMQTTWVSRPIPEDRPSDQELFGEFFNTGDDVMKDTVANHLVRYLEQRGVRHVFGLCGHTNIAVLSAMAGSRVEFINVRHEQVAAHAADGYARVTRKASVLLTHLGPGLTNAATGVANAALDCIPMVRHRRRCALALLRQAPAPGSEPARRRRAV